MSLPMELVSGGRGFLLSGIAPGFGHPGKAMTEKVVVSDPGPGVKGVIPQGLEQKTSPKGRGSCLPRELRIKLFDEVKRLRRKGLTHMEIIDEIQRRYGVRLSKSRISEWLRGIHSPYNGRYIPSIEFLRPSEELAYVIGVRLGDGYTRRSRRAVKGYNTVKIGLAVKDREFAVEFGRCLSKVLRRRTIKPRYRSEVGLYVVEVSSKTLYELLEKPVNLDRLKKNIEHCDRCMAAFVRGFADSEGYVNKSGYIHIYNTDLGLLEYVKDLLRCLDIESTGPTPGRRQGKTFYNARTMKRYTYKECYYIYVRANSYPRFYKKVGFTIKRKRKRLEEYLRRRQAKPPSPLSSLLTHSPTCSF